MLFVLMWIIWVVVELGRSKENRGGAAEFLASLQESKARCLSNCGTIVACYRLIA